MSQQEDDLRALAKIMDFLRAMSIVLVVINIYWFCPELHPSQPDGFFSTVNRVLGGFDRSCHLFHSAIHGQMVRPSTPRPVVPWHKGSEERGYYMAHYLDILRHGIDSVLPAEVPLHLIYNVYCRRLHLSAYVGQPDKPTPE